MLVGADPASVCEELLLELAAAATDSDPLVFSDAAAAAAAAAAGAVKKEGMVHFDSSVTLTSDSVRFAATQEGEGLSPLVERHSCSELSSVVGTHCFVLSEASVELELEVGAASVKDAGLDMQISP